MDIERRIELITRAPVEEVVTIEELRELLQTKEHPSAYDGFEPSGIAHLGSGLLRAIKIADLLEAGVKFKLFVADWHAWCNNKLGGSLENIQTAGKYLIEAWRACGVDTKKVEVVWASDVVKDPEYWKTVLAFSKASTVDRIKRCSTIIGRREGEMQYMSMFIYPLMQAVDPFFLKTEICQLGMDQRRVYMLSRELGPKLGYNKPIVISHHLMIGLQGPSKMGGFDTNKAVDEEIASKMSKSIPNTAIFIHDSPEEIKKKISEAFCPAKQTEENPILEICKYIVFRKQKSLNIDRPAKFGGPLEFSGYEELEKAFREGLHPADLKTAVSDSIIKILEPVRKHFEKDKTAKKLLEQVRGFSVTR